MIQIEEDVIKKLIGFAISDYDPNISIREQLRDKISKGGCGNRFLTTEEEILGVILDIKPVTIFGTFMLVNGEEVYTYYCPKSKKIEEFKNFQYLKISAELIHLAIDNNVQFDSCINGIMKGIPFFFPKDPDFGKGEIICCDVTVYKPKYKLLSEYNIAIVNAYNSHDLEIYAWTPELRTDRWIEKVCLCGIFFGYEPYYIRQFILESEPAETNLTDDELESRIGEAISEAKLILRDIEELYDKTNSNNP